MVTGELLVPGLEGPAGGKAEGLRRMARCGVQVPAFVVLPPGAAVERVFDAFEQVKGPGGTVAVRSSALDEDGASHSFAGQYDTVLGVADAAALRGAVRRCRASADGERVRAYRARLGLPDAAVAVVIQRMVVGSASGVMFTATPEDPDRTLISAGPGLGEGVVQGLVACDTFRVAREGSVTAEHTAKDLAVRLVEGAPRAVEIPPDTPTITDEDARALAAWGQRLSAEWGRPVDVEWTLADGVLHLLQCRPVTAPIPTGRRRLWDNSNIIESYNGVTTPLTYSFASSAYTTVYQLFLRAMGVRESVIQANQSTFPRMIGLVRGRVYYNLNAWYRVVALLPGYRANRAFMEQMMGVAEVAADDDAESAAATWQNRLAAVPELIRLGARLVWRLSRVDADNAAFRRHFDAVYAPWRARDLDALPPEQLVEAYESLERDLLQAWSVPIVNDFFTMIAYGLLRKLCADWVPHATELHNQLLAGEGDVESVQPMRDAVALAALVRDDPTLEATFRGADPAAAARAVAAHPTTGPAWARWLALYGDRCVDELKLESPSLRQDPRFLVVAVRNYLASDAAPDSGGGAALRAQAEATAFAAVRGLRGVLFRRVLAQARARVRDRENLRFLRTRVFGLARDVFRALGAHMARAGAIAETDDVFYLTVPEVLGWVRGTSPSVAFRETIDVRRREFDGYRAAPKPADRFATWGAVHAHNQFAGTPKPAPSGALRGTPCAPGIAEGVAAVLADPKEGATLNGEILVAFRTDPGWVPLYPSIAGLLVERGSLLSHSAVVAREIGLPTIIGIPGLTAAVASGDRLRIDGSTGAVDRV